MPRKKHCLDCHWCQLGPDPDGGPAYWCEYRAKSLSVGGVWRGACPDFQPIADEEPPAERAR